MNISEFQHRISQHRKPVVIDIWAPWCGPCRITKPILEKLAREYAGKVDFLPINADDSHEVLELYHVSGVPTVLAVHGGEIVGRVTGARDEKAYRTIFESLAEGKQVKVPLTNFDRVLRLTAGTLLIMIGLSTNQLLLAGFGVLLAILGVYDRCPVQAAIISMFKRK